MMREKPIYKTMVVMNPRRLGEHARLVSWAQIKRLSLFSDRLRLEKEDIPYASMTRRQLKDGCYQFRYGERDFCFTVQAYSRKGDSDFERTRALSNLIEAIVSQQTDEMNHSLLKLRVSQLQGYLFTFFLLLTLAVIEVILCAYRHVFLANPKLLLIFPPVIFCATVIMKELSKKVVRR